MNLIKIFGLFIPCSLLVACTATQQLPQPNYQAFQLSPGLAAAMLPPAGFRITPEHYGFVQPETFTRIKIQEIETPYSAYNEQITTASLAKLQLALLDDKEVEISGAKCRLLTLQQNIAGIYYTKLWLLAGDELSSIQVEASFPQSASNSHKEQIIKAIESLTVKTNQKQRVYTGLPFAFTKLGNFKALERFSNSLVLTLPNDANEWNRVVVSHGTTKEKISDLEKLSEHFLSRDKTFEKVEILNHKATTVDKIPALESFAYMHKEGQDFWVYQIVSVQETRFLLLQGIAPKKEKERFKEELNALISGLHFQ